MSKVVLVKDGKPQEFNSIEELEATLTEEERKNIQVIQVPPQPKEPPMDAIPYHAMPVLDPVMIYPSGQEARRERREQERKMKKKKKLF